jgi:hypothetical protein
MTKAKTTATLVLKFQVNIDAFFFAHLLLPLEGRLDKEPGLEATWSNYRQSPFS